MTPKAQRDWPGLWFREFDFKAREAKALCAIEPSRLKLQPPHQRAIVRRIAFDSLNGNWFREPA
jgi:hypothetical protein